MTYRKKLIEVSMPLEAINQESAREKSIRHGHPSTLHLWWARRPLAACRAVLFASLVDDPSAHPDKFPTEEEQQAERQRLHDLIGKIETEEKRGKSKQVVRGLVSWDDIKADETGTSPIIEAAQKEIARCLAWENDHEPPTEPEAVRKYLQEHAPPVYDPFCGGGSIPLEAQRLGIEAHGSDLNPVAVLITKALIEIPPKFKNKPPVNPKARKTEDINQWRGAQGLAEDVRYYGKWMRDEAQKRIGHLYPKVELPEEHGGGEQSVGRVPRLEGTANPKGEATVIAWLWARTVKCPNPACGCQMPLVRSFQLSKKKGKEAWVEPIIDNSQIPPVISFEVKTGEGEALEETTSRKGSVCLACATPSNLDYVRSEGKAGSLSLDEGGNGTTAYADAVATYLAFAVDRCSDYWSSICTWNAVGEKMRNTFARQAIPMTWDYAECNSFSLSSGNFNGAIDWIYKVIGLSSCNSKGKVQQVDATDIANHYSKPIVISTDPPYYDAVSYADLSDYFYTWIRRSLSNVYPKLFATLATPKQQELVAEPFRHGSRENAKQFFEDGLEKVWFFSYKYAKKLAINTKKQE